MSAGHENHPAPSKPASEPYKSFRLSAPVGSASRNRVVGAIVVCGICGFILGEVLTLLLAHYVFGAIKIIFFNWYWRVASALVVAFGFAVFPCATRIYHVAPRDGARAAAFGFLVTFLAAVVVALLFPKVHPYVSSNFYDLANPLIFFIPFAGVVTSVALHFRAYIQQRST